MTNNVYADEFDRMVQASIYARYEWEPAGDGGWYCTDPDSYDGAPDSSPRASAVGHGKTRADALADLIEKLEDR